MSIYAQAMAEANKIVLGERRNPSKEVEIKWNTQPTMDDVSWERIKATKIGKGAFAEAYLGVDNMVYIFIEDNTDPSKELLAHINIIEGAQPHIPIIKQVGWVDISKQMRGMVGYTAFQSPLYRVPLKKNEHPENYAIMRILQKYSNEAYHADPRGSRCDQGRFIRDYFLHNIESSYVEIDKQIEKTKKIDNEKASDEFYSVMTAIELMFKFANDYGDSIYIEFPSRNLGTDANGQLILLDIFWDKRQFLLKRGIKC